MRVPGPVNPGTLPVILETEGFLRKVDETESVVHKSNLTASTPPTASDDSAAGYSVYSIWVVDGSTWVCMDATASNAVWQEVTTDAIWRPCKVGTNANIANFSGGAPLLVVGITMVADDRVLVLSQTDQTENGIYRVVTPGTGVDGTWVRAYDAVADEHFVDGKLVMVELGFYNTKLFTLATNNPVELGTDDIIFTDLSSATDANAVHVNVDDEIIGITEKETPVGADLLLIEDSEASYAKKRLPLSNLPSGSGDVAGPASSTDNGIARFNGTGGKTIQNSDVTVDDDENVEDVNTLTFASEYDNGTVTGTTKTIDWGNGQKQKVTLDYAAITLSFTAPPGVGNFLLKVVQGGGGDTITWPSSVDWPSQSEAPQSTPINSVDIYTFYYDGTTYYGTGNFDFG